MVDSGIYEICLIDRTNVVQFQGELNDGEDDKGVVVADGPVAGDRYAFLLLGLLLLLLGVVHHGAELPVVDPACTILVELGKGHFGLLLG